ncbi:phosphatidylinositol-specific phospholipase C domain-containing protein [Chengkuizengella marina]|uniref:phosphatidylinositol-specific phospholipase C domain-containing protein n=1 Tax=Chengkuizengella marina TaxID=2507566 RepID=UPI00191BE97F|nr:phosphatidylinositol-specific phospholipase C domain-containing protein [Chengkuizengella marina]
MKMIKKSMNFIIIFTLLLPLVLTNSSFVMSASNENWMEQVNSNNPEFGNRTLREVILPGTHDAGTSTMDDANDPRDPGPDFWNLKDLFQNAAAHAGKSIVADWSQTQGLTIEQQLNEGIRYFDLRVAPNVWKPVFDSYQIQETNLRTLHGLYGESVSEIIADTKRFLDENEKEIVILDFQHFYEMTHNSYNHLNQLLQNTFGDLLIPSSYGVNVTLNQLWSENKRVIVLYGSDNQRYTNSIDIRSIYANDFSSWLWDRRSNVQSDWANTTDVNVLKQRLDQSIASANSNKFFVLQGVLTPSDDLIIDAVLGGLDPFSAIGVHSLHELARSANNEVPRWVLNDWANEPLNIVMLDWIHETDIVNIIRSMNEGSEYQGPVEQRTLIASITSNGGPQPGQKHRSSHNFSTVNIPSGTEKLYWEVVNNSNTDAIRFRVKEDVSIWTDPIIFNSLSSGSYTGIIRNGKLYIADPSNTGGNSFTVKVYAVK